MPACPLDRIGAASPSPSLENPRAGDRRHLSVQVRAGSVPRLTHAGIHDWTVRFRAVGGGGGRVSFGCFERACLEFKEMLRGVSGRCDVQAERRGRPLNRAWKAGSIIVGESLYQAWVGECAGSRLATATVISYDCHAGLILASHTVPEDRFSLIPHETPANILTGDFFSDAQMSTLPRPSMSRYVHSYT